MFHLDIIAKAPRILKTDSDFSNLDSSAPSVLHHLLRFKLLDWSIFQAWFGSRRAMKWDP